MALIGKIRSNSWILVVMIALGLGGFIVMDMTSGQQSLFGSSQLTLGEVEGKKLDWNQFNRTESILYGNSAGDVYARRNALWNYFVEEAIIAKKAETLGLGVSKTELIDLQFGPNPSPVIQQRFRDPATQMLDRQRLNEFKTAIETGQLTDPNLRAFWAVQEKEIIKDRLQSKINAMVSKAMYTPTWMVEMGSQESRQQVDVLYVKIPYDAIDNSEVSLSDDDFEQYLRENRALYERDEETRVMEYVSFDVMPTAGDSTRWRNQIAELIPEFRTTEDDSLFVERNFGIYDPAYFKKAQVSPEVADTLFRMTPGTVYGPYIEAGFYKAAKVLDKRVVPDSVRSRHILIPASDPVSLLQAQNRVDSLKNLIETGQATFDSLALRFGSDATRTKGGDLGYAGPGTMVKPFNDLIFYEANEGELKTVITQFGAHLVEVTGRKFINNDPAIKVAYIQQAIVPSEETQNELYDKAFAFVGSNKTIEQLRESVKADASLKLETAPPVSRNDFSVGALPLGQTPRDMVRWAFTAGKGDVSPEVYIFQDPVEFYNNKFVVAALRNVIKPGLPPVDAVRAQLETLVINRKKGELIAGRIQGKDMNAAAAQYNVPADTLRGVTFDQSVLPGLGGSEPKVIGTVFALDQGTTSEPIIGETGVYLVRPLTRPAEATAATDIPQMRRTMSASARAQVSFRLIQAMRDNADVEDNRSRFY